MRKISDQPLIGVDVLGTKTVTTKKEVFPGGAFEYLRSGASRTFVRDSNGDRFWISNELLVLDENAK